MRTFLQDGEILSLTAPSGGVTAGTPVAIGSVFCVPVTTAAEGETFAAMVTGVHSLPKTEAQAWTEGAAIYWDASPGEATTTATGNTLIGVAAAVADNPSTSGKVRLNGVGHGVGGTIGTAELEAAAVTAAKAAVFVSTEQTGTGSAQNVAHGLGVAPSVVLVAPTELVADLAAGYDCAEGTHTSTNVVVTVTTGAKFKVFAWA